MELTERQKELIDKAYEILSMDDFTAKLMVGAPIPPKKP